MMNMKTRVLTMAFTLALLGGLLAPRARADANNQEVLFRVDGPVELPGQVLGAGRYQVKLVPDTDQQVAGVWNANGTKCYGFFDIISVDRSPASNAKVVLSGSGKVAPKRVKDWFWTGDTIGHEFVYPVPTNNPQMAEMKTPQAVKN